MTRRPAVTLMEVLIAMFIMAIGMLALLALFPVGAVSMAQALKDDRCASTASMAENVAIAMNVRYDANVTSAFIGSPPPGTPNAGTLSPPSVLVYVDPYYAVPGPGPAGPPFGIPLGAIPGVSPGIPRVYPSFANTLPLADRWFSLPDDITYTLSGTADTSNTGGIIDRGRRYSYAYLLRNMPTSSTNLVQLYVVVYSGRPVNSLTPEPVYTAVGAVGTNSIVVSATGVNPWPTNIKLGGWILDPVNGYFYRVTNYSDFGTTTTVELQQNLVGAVTQIVVMDTVAEVFDKGTGWRP